MSELRPVYALWLTFREQCIPATASNTQRSVMRDSFYAGALALFQAMNASVSPELDTTAGDLELMDAIERDITGYPDRRTEEPP